MDQREFDEIVAAWVAGTEAERGSLEYEQNWWAIDQVMDWSLEGKSEYLWRFILAVYKLDISPKVVGMVAAGPVENLLAHDGPQYINRIAELARRDPKFNWLLGGVWRNRMTDEVWQRVQSARNEVW